MRLPYASRSKHTRDGSHEVLGLNQVANTPEGGTLTEVTLFLAAAEWDAEGIDQRGIPCGIGWTRTNDILRFRHMLYQ